MGDAFDKLRSALDETVGATAKRQEAEKAFLRELAETRASALADLKRRWRSEREAAAALVQRRVQEYAHAVSGALKESLSRDQRMPVTINHLERYAAMKAIQDRGQLLARIEQTLELARTAAVRAGQVDPQAAVAEAADGFRSDLMRVSQIHVAAVEEDEGEDEAGGALALSKGREELFASLVGDADSAFADDGFSLGIDVEGDASQKERRERFDKELQAAVERAGASHAQRLARNARSAAGSSVDLGDLESFDGTVSATARFDAGQVAELADLVGASFRTFSQVVKDNGVFAAFSEGSAFGRCVGYASWASGWDDWDAMEYRYDDSEYGGDPIGREYVRSRMPTAIEDVDEDGDSLQTAIDRMRGFNARRYFGLLDDDFKQHVDAFWYGFGKLMEFANGMVEVDLDGYRRYRARLSDVAAVRCGNLAVLMDSAQLAAYCEELGKMRDAARARERPEMLHNEFN